MQGIFIHGRRPKSKAELKRAVADEGFDPYSIVIEATSLHGNEFDGSLAKAERSLGDDYNVESEGPRFKQGTAFVGPDPYRDRRFYGQVRFVNGKWKVT